jgi:hypothetical protein
MRQGSSARGNVGSVGRVLGLGERVAVAIEMDELVAGHLDRGSWCDTYQQLYRLIRDLSVSSTNSRSFRFHFPAI